MCAKFTLPGKDLKGNEILEQLKEQVRGCVTAHWKGHVRQLKVSG